jgi:hypothetical protein
VALEAAGAFVRSASSALKPGRGLAFMALQMRGSAVFSQGCAHPGVSRGRLAGDLRLGFAFAMASEIGSVLSQTTSVSSALEARARFLSRTYNTLFLAIAAFALVEVVLFQTGLAAPIAAVLTRNWLLTLGGFMIVGWFGSMMAARATSQATALLFLGLYVVAEAVIFVPLLVLANAVAPGAIQSAATVTILGFAGLTGIAFWSRKDFTFLGSILRWAGLVALLLIGSSLLFGFELGTFFSVGMVALAGASILYNTSDILRNYPETAYIQAALSLFASVALMFWYVLRIFISLRD